MKQSRLTPVSAVSQTQIFASRQIEDVTVETAADHSSPIFDRISTSLVWRANKSSSIIRPAILLQQWQVLPTTNTIHSRVNRVRWNQKNKVHCTCICCKNILSVNSLEPTKEDKNVMDNLWFYNCFSIFEKI